MKLQSKFLRQVVSAALFVSFMGATCFARQTGGVDGDQQQGEHKSKKSKAKPQKQKKKAEVKKTVATEYPPTIRIELRNGSSQEDRKLLKQRADKVLALLHGLYGKMDQESRGILAGALALSYCASIATESALTSMAGKASAEVSRSEMRGVEILLKSYTERLGAIPTEQLAKMSVKDLIAEFHTLYAQSANKAGLKAFQLSSKWTLDIFADVQQVGATLSKEGALSTVWWVNNEPGPGTLGAQAQKALPTSSLRFELETPQAVASGALRGGWVPLGVNTSANVEAVALTIPATVLETPLSYRMLTFGTRLVRFASGVGFFLTLADLISSQVTTESADLYPYYKQNPLAFLIEVPREQAFDFLMKDKAESNAILGSLVMLSKTWDRQSPLEPYARAKMQEVQEKALDVLRLEAIRQRAEDRAI